MESILIRFNFQGDWWYGETNSGSMGWFPKSYVNINVTNGQEVPANDGGLNEYYVALYEYASRELGDLDFNQGEIILVVKKDGDWWTGVIGDRTGIFPSNYVDKCDAPSQVSKKNVIKFCTFKCSVLHLFLFFLYSFLWTNTWLVCNSGCGSFY